MIPPRPQPNRDLLKHRIQAGLSAGALGRQAGVSGKTVRDIERGKVSFPQLETQRRLAGALEQDILEVFPLERQRRFAERV